MGLFRDKVCQFLVSILVSIVSCCCHPIYIISLLCRICRFGCGDEKNVNPSPHQNLIEDPSR
jgi:hypothetical protein